MTRLTRAQRAGVVELLRCAADVVHETKLPVYRASYSLNALHLEDTAIDAACSVHGGDASRDDEAYRAELLEAAARVEEGSWP